MKLNYYQANELYSLLSNNFLPNTENDETLVNNLAGAINLVDECEKQNNSRIYVDMGEKLIRVSVKFHEEWPDFLYEQVNNNSVKIEQVRNKKVKLVIDK